MELCVQHALEKRNLSVDGIADLMGESNKWTLYKWIENGRIPAIKIRPFEHACGVDFVTEYLAHSANKLVLGMPTGRRAEHREVNELGAFMAATQTLIYKYLDGESKADETAGAITKLMEDLAFQRGNIEKGTQPELELNQ
jgi:hypothetical protein